MGPRHPWRLVVPALVAGVILFLSSLTGSRFATVPQVELLSYAGHAVEYALLGTALRWAVDGIRRPWTTAVLLGAILGIGDELLQSTVPGRDPSLLDYTVDVAAVTIAARLTGRQLTGADIRP